MQVHLWQSTGFAFQTKFTTNNLNHQNNVLNNKTVPGGGNLHGSSKETCGKKGSRKETRRKESGIQEEVMNVILLFSVSGLQVGRAF